MVYVDNVAVLHCSNPECCKTCVQSRKARSCFPSVFVLNYCSCSAAYGQPVAGYPNYQQQVREYPSASREASSGTSPTAPSCGASYAKGRGATSCSVAKGFCLHAGRWLSPAGRIPSTGWLPSAGWIPGAHHFSFTVFHSLST